MTKSYSYEEILAVLHEKCGFCGHCGKKNCKGKDSNSRLPVVIDTGKLLHVLHDLFKEEIK